MKSRTNRYASVSRCTSFKDQLFFSYTVIQKYSLLHCIETRYTHYAPTTIEYHAQDPVVVDLLNTYWLIACLCGCVSLLCFDFKWHLKNQVYGKPMFVRTSYHHFKKKIMSCWFRIHWTPQGSYYKGAFTHTRGKAMPRLASRWMRVQESATESKLVKRGEAVPRHIACHVVQYVHSGSIHT